MSTCDQSHDIPTAISHAKPCTQCSVTRNHARKVQSHDTQLRSVTRHPNCDQSHDTPNCDQSHDIMHARFCHTTPDCDQSHDTPTAISHTTPCTQCSVTRHPQLRSVTQHLRYFKLIILMSFN
jgi:hypothetical protein